MDMKEIGIGAAVVILLFFGASYFFDLEIEGIGAPPTTTIAGAASCPDDGVTTLNVKLWDDYAASGTYLADAEFYAKNMDSGVIENHSISSSSAWAAMDVECGVPYIVYATALVGTSGSAISNEFTASGNNQYINLHTNHLGVIQIRVKDITGDDFETLVPDSATDFSNGTYNTTAYVDLNLTYVYDGIDAAGGTDFSVGDGGYLDFYIYARAKTARYFSNDKGEIAETNTEIGFKNFLCVRQGTDNSWTKDSVIVAVDDGASLPNVITQIDSDSREHTYIDNSFACYDIGDISDTPKKIRFYISSDENPDTENDDITLYFLSEGFYLSSDQVDMIKTGIFTDASTQVGVTYDSSEVPSLLINVQ